MIHKLKVILRELCRCRLNLFGQIRETRDITLTNLQLDELAASIKQRGIIQPIIVRPLAEVVDAYRDSCR